MNMMCACMYASDVYVFHIVMYGVEFVCMEWCLNVSLRMINQHMQVIPCVKADMITPSDKRYTVHDKEMLDAVPTTWCSTNHFDTTTIT